MEPDSLFFRLNRQYKKEEDAMKKMLVLLAALLCLGCSACAQERPGGGEPEPPPPAPVSTSLPEPEEETEETAQ